MHISLKLAALFGAFVLQIAAAAPKPADILGHFPLVFEENRGQWNSDIKFTASRSGRRFFLTPQGITFSVGEGNSQSGLRFSVEGGDRKAVFTGESLLSGTSNFLRGSDSAKWRTSVKRFSAVRLRDIKPGIDVLYYGNPDDLEYDLVVRPGADAGDIRLRFEGADELKLNSNGDLVVVTSCGDVVQHKPSVWQLDNGQKTRVLAQYRLISNELAAVELSNYDMRRELTIDPSISFATYLGGTADTQPTSVALDQSGAIYVAGNTASADFPTTIGAYQTVLSGTGDAFVTKLSPDGSSIIYSTFLGGSNADGANAVAVDSEGNVYISGATLSPDFPTTLGSLAPTRVTANLFVTKLNSTGSGLVYSTFLGGITNSYTNDSIGGLAIDTSGSAYVAGTTYGNLQVTSGAYSTTLNKGLNARSEGFVVKLSPAGDRLIYGTYFGGVGDDRIRGLAIDALGQAYITGATTSTDLPVSGDAFQPTNLTPNSALGTGFVACLNSTGSGIVYGTYLGGTANSFLTVIAVDSGQNAYIAGTTGAKDFPVTPGAFFTSLTSPLPGFVSKLNPAGSGLVYSTLFPGQISTIIVDSSGSAILSGATTGPDFVVTPGAFNYPAPVPAYQPYLFFSKLNPRGTALSYSTLFGTSDLTLQKLSYTASGMALDNVGNPVIVGNTLSKNWPTPAASLQRTNRNANSFSTYGTGVVTKLDLTSPTICTLSLSTSSIKLPSTGGTGVVTVTAPSGCPWDVVANQGSAGSVPINLVSPSSGVGSGSFTYTVGAAPGSSANQHASITVGSLTIPVTQVSANSGPAKAGVYQPSSSLWVFDSNGSGGYDAGDRLFSFVSSPGDIALAGDWTGDGNAKVGVYRNGFWLLDLNNNGVWDGPGVDRFIALGGQAGDVPVIGDWNNDGRTKVGIYRRGFWFLDSNGNGVFDSSDQSIAFGGNMGEQPVLGDWNGDGRTKVGIFYNGSFALDYDGDNTFTAADKFFTYIPYAAGDKPLVGDWTGNGSSKIGIYRNGFWILDHNGNGIYDYPVDKFYGFGGNAGEIPLVGDWSGDGRSKIGFYLHGFWALDFNGNGTYDGIGPGQDRFFGFGGTAGEQPIVGSW